MIRRFKRPRWTCVQCLYAQRRANATSAAAARPSPAPATFTTADNDHDDQTLRRIFDSQHFWDEFLQKSRHQVGHKSAGLLGNRYLMQPEGFQTYAQATLLKCQKLVEKILAVETVEGYKGIVRDMDRLSDWLCRVIDLADFVRMSHPDRRFQAAATAAYATMFEYMNKLNTTTGLNDQLKRAAAIPEVLESWSEEEKTVANILIRDFSKSAIDLPDGARNDFVEISNEIAKVGSQFEANMAPEKPYINFSSSRLRGMDPTVVKRLTRFGTSTVPTTGSTAVIALRQIEDPDVRREIYVANRTASKASVKRLEKLLNARSRLAKVAGYPTYGHMALSDKMAQTPEAVNQFLEALLADTRPQVQEELQDLLDLKESDARSDNFPHRINAWDRDYYTSRLLSGLQTRIRPDTLAAFFSLGSVLQGLSRLFTHLYGIRLVPRETLPGEAWTDDVRRLDVIDDSGNHIAVVYCDLFSRPGKSPNPAHFTLRCSRAISDAEVAEYAHAPHAFASPLEAATDGMAAARDPVSGTFYQLPTIALICDFPRPAKGSTRPTLLSFRDVQTLFHEMGHAAHSMLGRTELQNVSGTRCATDFAELPSVLMEHFAFAPKVLGLWARHWETGKALPYELVQERLELEKRTQGAETEAQILLAMLDQRYHGVPAGEGSVDSTAVYHDVFDTFASVHEPAGTAWQGFFGHMYGYGAVYYSYLFDRAIANRVWKCVAGVLGDERLEHGGEEAMKEVGRWGVREGRI
ncbi:zincin [Trichodelitschia bisporula]|uniref:Mitochondrial intermediate peptidase n=1 Tax=Trichodelitschia bisporula TaxID=703511 RepID=A0A6G1HVE3_9PEZI|nr:zincin [Trichodelitschia bisporula]